MNSLNFELGEVVQTRAIYEASERNKQFYREVQAAFKLYLACNWGKTSKEDKPLNDAAVKNGNDRILAKYGTSEGDIFIQTESDRSYTTVFFCNEY